jgi:hypothetical protein
MEPRLYATPGTIGSPPKSINDVQNSMVFFASYGTTYNPNQGGDTEPDAGDDEGMPDTKDIPMDLFWTMTDNWGESYMKVYNDGAKKWQYPWLAHTKGDDDTAQFSAAQIRTNPAGTKLFASFQADVETTIIEDGSGPCKGNGQGSDVCFNGTLDEDPFVRYDLNEDGKVDRSDLEILISTKIYFDGDGQYTGHDMHLLLDAIVEYNKRPAQNRRLTYLRGGE